MIEELSYCSIDDDLKGGNETILTIDIGVHHLSLVLSRISNYKISEILSIDLVNITEYTHTNVPLDKCTLHHTKTFFDWIKHVIQEYGSLFDRADTILIERQPPMGFVAVEQLLFGFYRDKTILVSPNSVHAFHKFQELDYEQRKVASEIIALPYLAKDPNILARIKGFERSHDVTDAIIQLLYYLNKITPKSSPKISPKSEWKCTNLEESLNYLEKFRYKIN